MPRLLVVDDERLIIDCFCNLLSSAGVIVDGALSATEALSAFRQNSYDAVLVDVHLPDRSGMQLLSEIQAVDSRIPVILMTGRAIATTAIEAMRKGAFEYLVKPVDPDHLLVVVRQALDVSRMARNQVNLPLETRDPAEDETLIGNCPAMQDVFRQIGRVTNQDVTVLILGESGTGKELVARAIYQYSKRANKPFRAINCAAIPESLLESELFGHEKGSFSGAERKRIGKFEQCDGGTLFLDEIGDMTPLTQSKVLRVLQDQQFERVGGGEAVRTNVRLIAATNRNLVEMMERETFRKDLYFRLNVYTIQLPPLRERASDIPQLVYYFLKRFNRELDKSVVHVSPEAMNLLNTYSWPGNLRELQSVLKHAVIVANSSILLPEFLPETVRGLTPHSQLAPAAKPDAASALDDALRDFVHEQLCAGNNLLYEDAVKKLDRILLPEALKKLDGNVSRTAVLLGMSRSTLRGKLTELGLSLDRSIRVTDQPREPIEEPTSLDQHQTPNEAFQTVSEGRFFTEMV